MINEKYEDLLHRALDGEVTPEEAERLREYVAANPDARASYDDLQNLFQVLASVEPVEPPVGSQGELLRRLREARPVPSPRPVESGLATAVGALRRRLTLSTAYAFAVGAIAGVAVFAAIRDHSATPRLDDSALPGSMLPRNRSEFQVVDQEQVALAGFRADVRIRMAPGFVTAEIEVRSDQLAELVLDFDGKVLSPIGFEQSHKGAGLISLGDARVRLENAGQNRYLVVFSEDGGTGSDLVIRVLTGGSSQERHLRTRPEGH
jgi:anti-sigma factor RsiW